MLSEEETLENIWNKIDFYREVRGFTWASLGLSIGSGAMYGRIGKNLTVTTLSKLANSLEIPLEFLLESDNSRESIYDEDSKAWGVSLHRPTGTFKLAKVFTDHQSAVEFVLAKGSIPLPDRIDNFLDPLNGNIWKVSQAPLDLEGLNLF